MEGVVMEIKLFDSELKIMDVLWKGGETTAKHIAEILKEQIGWSKTTTYTVIKKCIDKGVIQRKEPNFICCPLVTKDQVREFETRELINKMYDGSADHLVAALLGNKNVTQEEIRQIRQLIEDLK